MERPDGPDLLDQAFTRAAGAALVPGNSVRLLRDGAQNYPQWLQAIAGARRHICFENFIFYEDEVGAEFSTALIERAHAGVEVRVVYDWLGCLGKSSRHFWRTLLGAGVLVRCFNSPHAAHPILWLQRDHRKLLTVDGEIGFVTGLCVGKAWRGFPERNIAPWRDTGVEVRGPALVEMENAFAESWDASVPLTGRSAALAPLALQPFVPAPSPAAAGTVALRVVATTPGMLAVLRLDQLIAAAARRTLWITDAYFAGIPPYIQALRAAALDGVDVRLLVPGASDISILRPLSQAGYRPLLEAGVRVFEWKGSMLHAKTAVADGRWARVGSSNLNIASWVGNYELDALIENEDFAAQMERMFESDLAQSTEIVLRRNRRRLGAAVASGLRGAGLRRRREDRVPHELAEKRSGGRGRAAAGALRIGRTVGAALTEQRVLATTEAKIVAVVAVIALLLAICVVIWPWVAAAPVALFLVWASLVLVTRAVSLRRERQRRGLPAARLERRPGEPAE
ncbi:MAG TPA: phospholipase D-like domain-containing protein [Steroidobacteraceae bacterium]|jgi:cardiolipin synthase|nr:phospholipase D-like domain-containing protein [Steroidobacteraceae bacterium]